MTDTTTTPTTTETFAPGDQVKIAGENGYYWVVGEGADGSISLWGGDKNPNGSRSSRAVMADRLSHDRRDIERKSVPSFVRDRKT